ncbi:hypothetical protein FC62_GL000984 [Amylolactobacillus amylotrophicus DSM 20534]|uniref:Uncharacterized protein n=3 Tax=Amylolactobacillus TaxID=2767876 RepID=A0A1L6XBR9_9LACO|nr:MULTISPECIES: DUF6036 family nucleotidyltransferase [Amylolactobacillus]APT18420.1 hypothetical protein LA20533_03670 [Amylolactobacillus amylophilus DSM 20533 = JCM 1125]KRK38205.1 hypothetical protein FC62_GL000984 [Amylolactobacillus amylotrophicus DSM 20534]KRM43153.1 hypothetical protein FD40_GL000161 [Amylolactobacillus amylophilus DSM 20533 = JCM 1125]GED80448.1 hypothetical protein LAM01_09210 [Amylolactobacillus amylophilus]
MEYIKLFDSLNKKLARENLELDIHCVGGFVLEYYGLKATSDIDAFYESNEKIDRLIDEVGNEYGVGTNSSPWLNNSIQNIISNNNLDQETTIYAGTNLTVNIASLETIFEDKIVSSRVKDREDIKELMIALNKHDLASIMKIYEYSDGTTDPAVIVEAYINAFGRGSFDEQVRDNPELKRYLI